eukprot:TRINITY_DN5874_c0_g1_i4.p1 TRINITY_DN5874_c0_g1~~TRINITY_DN5874_c0_g1_i4.p1  ORF type:complete len:683 (+),score=147.99 TRINITY_DN5874_c0_g1_i4:57-2105(+)
MARNAFAGDEGRRRRSRSRNRRDRSDSSDSRKRKDKRKVQKKRSRSRRRSPSLKKQNTGKAQQQPARRKTSSSSSPPARASPRRSPSRTRMEVGRDGADYADGDYADAPKQVQYERITIKLNERPFGMQPNKEEGAAGYVIGKLADGRPADKAGVKVGWRVVEVAGSSCKDSSVDATQALLKNANLPVDVVFEREAEPLASDDEDSEDVCDVGDQRVGMREGLNIETMDELPVMREPEGMPLPIKNWKDAVERQYINKAAMEKLQAAGLKRPTLIQRHAVPILGHNNGHYDGVVMAQTGSGKTFAFVIPSVGRILVQGAMPRPFFPGKSPGCPLLLVLSPTRELAMQTHKEIEVMIKGTPLLQCCIYGGESLGFQGKRVEKEQIDILCATPGRLIDLIDMNKISLSFVQTVVLDEADQMLEQSLEIMCQEILVGRDMPAGSTGRQTLLFSATMPPKIKEMCPTILRADRQANLTIGHYGDEHGGSCEKIRQVLRWVPDETQRIGALCQDLQKLWIAPGKQGRVVIFTNQRIQAGHVAQALIQGGIPCVHLHGKLDQHVREEVFNAFRTGKADVLVATNVASRGLDFADISFVVQFHLPQTIDIYTHRIGRTGRAGQVGCALAYMGPRDRRLAEKLIQFMELNKQEVPDFLFAQAEIPGGGGGGGGFKGGKKAYGKGFKSKYY